MSDTESTEPTEAPATWENVVVGKAKEVIGELLHDKDLVEQGETQSEVAHDVHEEYDEQRRERS